MLRLSLTGELDRASAPILEDRLAGLRVVKAPVRLDLSKLEFIDSTGIRLLIQSVGDARIKGWQFQIERELSAPVASLFRLVRLDRFVGGEEEPSVSVELPKPGDEEPAEVTVELPEPPDEEEPAVPSP